MEMENLPLRWLCEKKVSAWQSFFLEFILHWGITVKLQQGNTENAY